MVPKISKPGNSGKFKNQFPLAAHDCEHIGYHKFFFIRVKMLSNWATCSIDTLNRECEGRCLYYSESFSTKVRNFFRSLFIHDGTIDP